MNKYFIRAISMLLCLVLSISMITACGGEEEIVEMSVTGVVLSASEYTFTNSSESFQLTAVVSPNDAVNKNVTWASVDTNVAYVDETGKVRPYSNGRTVITATTAEGGFTASCNITVTLPPPPEPPVVNVTSVALDITEYKFTALKAEQLLSVDVFPGHANDKSVVWESSDPSIVTVDENGLMTSVKKGNATITVKSNDGSFTASCEVTVAPASSGSSGSTNNKKLPSVTSPKVKDGYLVSDNLEAFNEVNSDAVAWLYLPGTNINFPVGNTTNNEYYLTRGFDKKEKYSGSAFLDWRNKVKETGNFTEQHTIIYGHAKSTDIFDQLENETLKSSWYSNKENLYVYVNTLKKETVWQVFATYYTDSGENYYLNVDFPLDKEEIQAKLDKMTAEEKLAAVTEPDKMIDLIRDEDAFFAFVRGWKDRVENKEYTEWLYLRDRVYDVKIEADDKILTLSTCADGGAVIKYVLHAKLIRSRDRTSR